MKNEPSYILNHTLSSMLFVDSNMALKIGLKEAMILQKVHFWLHANQNLKQRNGLYWVSKTYEQWKGLFPFWSTRTIQRTILNLEGKGFLETHLNGGYRTLKYYTINYDALRRIDIDLK